MGYLAASVDANIQRQIENAAASGKMFYVTTNQYSVTAGGASAGVSVFFTARATKIILVSAQVYDSTAATESRLRKTTSDPALAGHSISGLAIANTMAGGGAATSGGTLTSATEGVSSGTGTTLKSMKTSINSGLGMAEMLQKPSDYVIIPPNVAGGFLLLTLGASAEIVLQEMVWVEI